MKKSFNLTAPNKKPARIADSVKHDIKKYIARERRKELPDNVDFWDFDCRIGEDDKSAKTVHIAEINKKITEMSEANSELVYIEILAKPGIRTKKSN